MAETDYERAYRRAVAAVEAAVEQGLITVPEREDGVLRVAEHFLVGLGVNPE